MGYLPLNRANIRCPHCGHVDWSRVPQLKKTLQWVAKQKRPVTSNEVSKALGVTLDVASHRMSILADAQLVHVRYISHKKTVTGQQGGRLRLFVSAIDPAVEFETVRR